MARRILVTGSRGWSDAHPIGHMIDEAIAEHGEVIIIHGGARGADALANAEARRRGVQTIVEKADWDQHGKAAGPIRNQKMLDVHHPDEVHAFRSEGKSSGTDDMIARSRRAGLPVTIHTVTYTAKPLL